MSNWNMPPGVSTNDIPGNGPREDELDCCSYCGAEGDGVSLAWYTDEGDPSVGYGLEQQLLCGECAERLGLEKR